MKIVIEGCAHGELEKIYESIEVLENTDKIKVDLLICCGDFQATRNEDDLECMAVPNKFRQMRTFYKYYNGEKIAPVLTLFIGGNHEASNHLQELPYGGWVAPNIYYLGYAGVVNFGGLRIAGLSGIYKPYDYSRGHFERPPYNKDTKRSVYHIRNIEVFRLKQMHSPIDIFLSHDWPRGIYNYGNVQKLLQNKHFFKEEIAENTLGSEPCEELLFHLKPRYWFAAHLHCKFSALVPHKTENDREAFTRFLALDKCLPFRKFLQVIDIPCDKKEPLKLKYDLEWLAILHYTNHLTSVKHHINPLPVAGCDERWNFTPTNEEREFILTKICEDLVIPDNFSECPKDSGHTTPKKGISVNHQTRKFCEKLGVDDPMTLFESSTHSTPSTGPPSEPNDLSYSDVSFIDDSGNENSFISNEADKDDSSVSPISQGRMFMLLPPPKFSHFTNSFSGENDSKYDSNLIKEKVVEEEPKEVEEEPKEVEEEPKEVDGLFILDESPKRKSEENNQTTPTINIKKFKRRNKDIYWNNDD